MEVRLQGEIAPHPERGRKRFELDKEIGVALLLVEVRPQNGSEGYQPANLMLPADARDLIEIQLDWTFHCDSANRIALACWFMLLNLHRLINRDHPWMER